MRRTLVHQIVVTGLFLLGTFIVLTFQRGPSAEGLPAALLMGTTLMLAFTGPILRFLSVWPLIPRCPGCGTWVNGFYRAAHPQGVLLVSPACGHAFRMEGEWIVPIFRDSYKIAYHAMAEMGWMLREDGRAFRFKSDYVAVLLDADGKAIVRRRAKWPYWIVSSHGA